MNYFLKSLIALISLTAVFACAKNPQTTPQQITLNIIPRICLTPASIDGKAEFQLDSFTTVKIKALNCEKINNTYYGYLTEWSVNNKTHNTTERYFFGGDTDRYMDSVLSVNTEKLSSNLISITEGNERGADIYYFWRSAPKKIFAYHLKFNLPDEGDYTSKLKGSILTISRTDTLTNKKFGKDITLIFDANKGIFEKK